MNWSDGESNPIFCSISLLFFQRFDHGVALKIERKVSHLNIAFNRYAYIGTVMHYIVVISIPLSACPRTQQVNLPAYLHTNPFKC